MKHQNLYFLGIGGIGMSALARWHHHHGATVAGYDRTATELTEKLKAEGIPVDTSGDPNAWPPELLSDLQKGRNDRWTIVRTPAVPENFPPLIQFREAGFSIVKRAELLGQITRSRPLLAVAGTHGKTTTSTLLAHLLHQDGTPTEAFLGGIFQSTGSNLVLSDPNQGEPWTVAEADEFDRSFLALHPRHAAITSADPDHLDIYGTAEALHTAMIQFARQVKPGGLILHLQVAKALCESGHSNSVPHHTLYGMLEPNQPLPNGWAGGYTSPSGPVGNSSFTLHLAGQKPMDITWPMPGVHNAANACAAAALAMRAGLRPESVQRGLTEFPGIARRFEIRHQTANLTVIDDYAHHPSEIESTIAATRSACPGQRVVGVFQPHLFSRTRDFLNGFAEALSNLDYCLLLPIYPAREKPIKGVDAQAIGEKMVGCPVECPAESQFLDVLERCEPKVLLFMGAGDLDRWIPLAIKRLSTPTSNRETTP